MTENHRSTNAVTDRARHSPRDLRNAYVGPQQAMFHLFDCEDHDTVPDRHVASLTFSDYGDEYPDLNPGPFEMAACIQNFVLDMSGYVACRNGLAIIGRDDPVPTECQQWFDPGHVDPVRSRFRRVVDAFVEINRSQGWSPEPGASYTPRYVDWREWAERDVPGAKDLAVAI